MTVALKPLLRRSCGVVLMGLELAAGACGRAKDPDRERELASSAAERLVGIWTLRLTQTEAMGVGRGSSQAEPVQGTVALIESRATIGSATVAKAMHVGSFDADLWRWGIPRSASGAGRAVIGRTWGDSVELVLGPDGSDRVMRLRGAWRNDSVLGSWEVAPRAAAGAIGRFTLARAAPAH
jgi:hypothetical protein